jgi:hypothetical protein
MGVDAAAAAAAGKTKTRCDLCGGAAAVHCAADSAFLCLRCDARVHGANFLASRHQRRRLLGAADSTTSSASSGSCVSTADSAESTAAATARESVAGRRARAEAVLEGWATRMGFEPGAARRRAAAAHRALGGPLLAAARVPLRVAMAAALWSEVSSGCKAGGRGDAALLCRLEATAHVPARLVLAVASCMSRTRRSSAAAEEGWAEC